jgi:3-hydroxybutyrate dehydrogenase
MDKISESRYGILDINITHPIRVTQMAISHFLMRKKPGVVVHISSVAGQEPFFPTPMYVASKHAINGFVRSMYRLENPPPHLPKIRVNAVAPARILTPLWTDHPEKLKMVNQDNPGWISPEEVADVMLDLIQKEEYVGGTIIEVGERIREVSVYNDPGPSGEGNNVEHDKSAEVDMWESLERQYGDYSHVKG